MKTLEQMTQELLHYIEYQTEYGYEEYEINEDIEAVEIEIFKGNNYDDIRIVQFELIDNDDLFTGKISMEEHCGF